MATETLEERVAALEIEVERLKERLPESEPPTPWWQQISGIFKDDPMFDEAMRLGREWRQSQVEEYDDNLSLDLDRDEEPTAMRSLEDRMSALESEIAAIKSRLPDQRPWCDKIYGTVTDAETHDEIVRLGREYRESLRPKDDDVVDPL